MPKKSKPKQRTNWKQRALHCEEVLDIQNTVARTVETRMEQEIIDIAADRAKYKARAESAEKHNALLLEEREASKPKEPIPDTPHWIWREGQGYVLEKSGLPYETPWEAEARIQTAADKCEPELTHWQRFKSFLKRVARI